MNPLTDPLNWLAGIVLGLLLAASCNLDGPSDIEVMQLVAQDAQVRVVLP